MRATVTFTPHVKDAKEDDKEPFIIASSAHGDELGELLAAVRYDSKKELLTRVGTWTCCSLP